MGQTSLGVSQKNLKHLEKSDVEWNISETIFFWQNNLKSFKLIHIKLRLECVSYLLVV